MIWPPAKHELVSVPPIPDLDDRLQNAPRERLVHHRVPKNAVAHQAVLCTPYDQVVTTAALVEVRRRVVDRVEESSDAFSDVLLRGARRVPRSTMSEDGMGNDEKGRVLGRFLGIFRPHRIIMPGLGSMT